MSEKISAWLDGELESEAMQCAYDEWRRDPANHYMPATYWMIGDAVRDVMSQDEALGADFTAKVLRALEHEPTVLAPRTRPRTSVRQMVWPVAAAAAGVVVVAWLSLLPHSDQVAPLAPPTVASNAKPLTEVANAEELDRTYLMAHQSVGGIGVMPGVASYIRTVSDSRDTAR